jgi:holo-[acyl-carrier protein] synthase
LILGVGTDLASIDRISGILREQGERFISRCFAPEEREKVEKSAKGNDSLRAAGYARRWAAKEAAAKALGLGIREDVFLKDIVVVNDDAGKPSLILRGGAKERLTALTPAGMTAKIYVSLSDEPPMAAAFVVVEAVDRDNA